VKLMITGAEGQLGNDLTKVCRQREIECSASDLPQLDITDLEAVRGYTAAERPDAIVNCAAYNAVDRAEEEFELARRVNGEGPANLAQAAAERDIPVMHFSTDYVFDGSKTEPYTVDDEPGPLSRYAESKLLGEQLVREANPRHFVVRLSWVFGAANVNFVNKVLEWSENRRVVKVVDDQISRPAYSVDLAPIVLDMLATGAWGLYHLANTGICSRFEWARHIVACAGRDVEIEPAKTADFNVAAERPVYSAMDLSATIGLLGREPPDWRDATSRFLEEIGARK